MKKKLGVIINPVAGIGGRAGLKGSDGIAVQKMAKERGGKSLAAERTLQALKIISEMKDDIELITYPYQMGEDVTRLAGFKPHVIGSIKENETTPEDTIAAAKEMAALGVDLLLFAGGDGTARNIYSAIGNQVPVVGIPAGVKIYSSVYAVNPRSAGKLALLYLQEKISTLRESEVMDIDETAFREGRVNVKLYGYLQVPLEETLVQNVKSGGHSTEADLQGIANDIIEQMEKDTVYIVGPGTTTRAIMEKLGLQNTLLGVDVIKNKQLIANDVSEQQLFELIQHEKAKVILTVIGGQGHILGRGNQQLSPRIIRKIGKENIIVIATKEKLLSIPSYRLLVDTGDVELDEYLSGYIKVHTNYNEETICKVDV